MVVSPFSGNPYPFWGQHPLLIGRVEQIGHQEVVGCRVASAGLSLEALGRSLRTSRECGEIASANRFGIPFWLVGEFTTHFRTYSSWDWDVHWGVPGLLKSPWPLDRLAARRSLLDWPGKGGSSRCRASILLRARCPSVQVSDSQSRAAGSCEGSFQADELVEQPDLQS